MEARRAWTVCLLWEAEDDDREKVKAARAVGSTTCAWIVCLLGCVPVTPLLLLLPFITEALLCPWGGGNSSFP